MKKVFAVLVLALLVAGGVFAQVGNADNWVGGQISFLGGGVKYERVLTSQFTVGGAAYFNYLIFWNNAGIKAFGRFYPWENIFFAELGLGYGYRSGFDDYKKNGRTYSAWFYSINGFLLEPGVGWKIDVGGPAGFYIEPVLTIPLVFGSKKFDISGADSEFGFGVGFIAAFGMGYAF
jgi:hypothetical protein